MDELLERNRRFEATLARNLMLGLAHQGPVKPVPAFGPKIGDHAMRQVKWLIGAALVVMTTGIASGQELTGTLKKIKETGTITIGHRESSIPFSYYDDKQQVVGYAMDLCAKIVDAVKAELKLPGLQVNLQPVTSSNRIPLLQNG